MNLSLPIRNVGQQVPRLAPQGLAQQLQGGRFDALRIGLPGELIRRRLGQPRLVGQPIGAPALGFQEGGEVPANRHARKVGGLSTVDKAILCGYLSTVDSLSLEVRPWQ